MNKHVSLGMLAVATALSLATPASAADLGRDSPYDDPRYGDIYRHPDPRPAPRAYAGRDDDDDYRDPAPRYAPPYREPYYRHPSQRVPPPRAYSYDDRTERGCTPRHVIRDELHRRGWRDLHAVTLRPHIAVLDARSPDGRQFRLRIDRCTGAVVGARPLGLRPYTPYAYAPRYAPLPPRPYWN